MKPLAVIPLETISQSQLTAMQQFADGSNSQMVYACDELGNNVAVGLFVTDEPNKLSGKLRQLNQNVLMLRMRHVLMSIGLLQLKNAQQNTMMMAKNLLQLICQSLQGYQFITLKRIQDVARE